MVCQVSAMAPPPAWAEPGTKVTYQAALTPPYYAIDPPDDPMDQWVHHEGGTGVFGYLTDTITAGGDAAGGYSGDSVVVSGIDGGEPCTQVRGHTFRGGIRGGWGGSYHSGSTSTAPPSARSSWSLRGGRWNSPARNGMRRRITTQTSGRVLTYATSSIRRAASC
ncbi:hypothetical protein [Methanoculleus chikugoensis]|uniref:hypothetical protein n=1 Tax=Methanoculleus chikugoensis TaxID=118126 RepID=UPI001FB3F6AE|nr:hypothetical protein [Methanoculleus chikugoensis]